MSGPSAVRLGPAAVESILSDVAELADVAAAKDIALAVHILGVTARRLGVDPQTLDKYRELDAL